MFQAISLESAFRKTAKDFQQFFLIITGVDLRQNFRLGLRRWLVCSYILLASFAGGAENFGKFRRSEIDM